MLISEMSLEVLQDYAKGLEELSATQKTELEEKNAKNKELNDLNIELQKRNQALFKKIDQQTSDSEGQERVEQNTQQTCEDFALKNYKELIKWV